MSDSVTVHKAPQGQFQQLIEAGGHHLFADLAAHLGGEGAGLDPHQLLNASLGACTALTVTLVARRRQIPLEDLKVVIDHEEADGVYTLHRRLEFVGPLTVEQRDYLTGIANRCPIHKLLTGRIVVETVSAPAPSSGP